LVAAPEPFNLESLYRFLSFLLQFAHSFALIMPRCTHCDAPLSETARFCSGCGSPVSSISQMPTAAGKPLAPSPRASSAAEIGRLDSSSSFDAGGFAPGAVIAERYRVIGLLGRGGMGEVYRADDLKLGQSVALKFLPSGFSKDAVFLDRFRAEVRNARQVSHPNVCRVYDIGEIDGHHFLSMEYVDGENLATLLRRIGRLPGTKALEIARQLCAGLAAAHAQGVLHRDIKPSNVMIDGHGRAKLTDFGLAVRGDEAAAGEISGTPAYMAPEQIAGRGATVQSDLYSLGLVLYEVYTGKKTFEASSFADWRRAHTEEQPTALSHHAADIDAAVERAILRCLEKDPAKRPASAPQLAASLPGGDPLAAALAAGETPSPEMVAAAGAEGALAPGRAWTLLGSVVAALIVVLIIGRFSNLLRWAPMEDSPQVLAARSRDLVKKLGYASPPQDSVHWLAMNNQYLVYRAEHLPSPQRIRDLAAASRHPVVFYYRQSPWPMVPWTLEWLIQPEDPPHDVPGMATVVLDGRSHLVEFRAVAPEFDDSKGPWAEPDWNLLFTEAGLEADRFTRVPPKWRPMEPFDAQATWDGTAAQEPATPLHVVAAAFHGKPVFFRVIGPWIHPPVVGGDGDAGGVRSLLPQVVIFIVASSVTVVGFFIARRNLLLGRGDRRGATRLALAFFLGASVAWILSVNHVSAIERELDASQKATAVICLVAAGIWAAYIALEPFVRRHWPHLLFSWSRLLSGQFRDPLVGTDLLVGVGFGALMGIIRETFFALPAWFNLPGLSPRGFDRSAVGGPLELAGAVLTTLGSALALSLTTILLIFLLRMILRKDWLAIFVTVLLLTLAGLGFAGAQQVSIFIALARALLANGLIVFVLVRYGLLACVGTAFTANLILSFPMTLDFSHWYASNSLAALLVILGLATYGFYTSLAGRPLFGSASLDD
jgi:serine/threonine-protein kinase